MNSALIRIPKWIIQSTLCSSISPVLLFILGLVESSLVRFEVGGQEWRVQLRLVNIVIAVVRSYMLVRVGQIGLGQVGLDRPNRLGQGLYIVRIRQGQLGLGQVVLGQNRLRRDRLEVDNVRIKMGQAIVRQDKVRLGMDKNVMLRAGNIGMQTWSIIIVLQRTQPSPFALN